MVNPSVAARSADAAVVKAANTASAARIFFKTSAPFARVISYISMFGLPSEDQKREGNSEQVSDVGDGGRNSPRARVAGIVQSLLYSESENGKADACRPTL